MNAAPILQFPQSGESAIGDRLTPAEKKAFGRYLAELSSLEDGFLTIGQATFHVSDMHKETDPEAFAAAHTAFRYERVGQLVDLVGQFFPSPVAYCYYMFANGFENEHQRLLFLRDAWESLARFVHALIVSEVRERQVDLRSANLSFSDLFSERIGRILDNI